MNGEFKIRLFTISQMWIGKKDIKVGGGWGYSMSQEYLFYNAKETNESFVITGIRSKNGYIHLSTDTDLVVREYTMETLLHLIRDYHLISPRRVLEENCGIVQICDPILTSSVYVVKEVEKIIKSMAKKIANGYLSTNTDRYLACLNEEIAKYSAD